MKAPFDILVLDVGGTNVKLRATGQEQLVRIPSGRNMSARQMMSSVRRKIRGWSFQAVSAVSVRLSDAAFCPDRCLLTLLALFHE
jgi:hypothetical protein